MDLALAPNELHSDLPFQSILILPYFSQSKAIITSRLKYQINVGVM